MRLERIGAIVVTVLLVSVALGAVVLTMPRSASPDERVSATMRAPVPEVRASEVGPEPSRAPAPTISPWVTVIAPNGSVENASAPISVNGSVYTVISSFAGALLDERNGSTLVGTRVTLTATSPAAPVVELYNVQSVTVQGFTVVSAGTGIQVTDSGSARVLNDTVDPSASFGVDVMDSELVTISNDTVSGTLQAGISVSASGDVWVSDDNCSGSAIGVWVLGSENTTIVNDILTGSGTGLSASADSVLVTSSNQLGASTTGISLNGVVSATLQGDVGKSGSFGLIANNVNFVNATGESLSNYTQAVSLGAAYHVSIVNSPLIGCIEGVDAMLSGAMTFEYDNLSEFTDAGMVFNGVSNSIASHNTVSDGTGSTATAFELSDDSGVTLFDNIADGNPAGITDTGSTNLTLSANLFEGGGGLGTLIALQNDGQLNLIENIVHNATVDAFTLADVTDATLTDNLVFGAGGNALVVQNSTGVEISREYSADVGGNGETLLNSTGVTVWGGSELRTGAPAGFGIFAYALSGALIAFNNLSGCKVGIALANGTGDTLVDNNASGLPEGISFSSNIDATIVANQFWNDALGFAASNDSGVAVYHNNFGNDAGWKVGVGAQRITWDAGYPQGGNFWSNHTGPDTMSGPAQNQGGADGIVDTPVTLGAAGVDRYPLTTPWIPNYAIFSESGLLTSTQWSLVINGVKVNAVAPSPIVYSESNAPNATISWTIVPVPGFTLSGVAFGGPWPEPRANLSYTITYFPYRYPTQFQEFGLAPGTPWSLVANGIPEGGDTSVLTISLPNGTYSYLAGVVPGYNLSYGSGDVIVAGPGQLLVIVYSPNPVHAATTYSLGTVELLATGFAVAVTLALLALGLYMRERRSAGRRPPPLRRADTEGATSPPGKQNNR